MGIKKLKERIKQLKKDLIHHQAEIEAFKNIECDRILTKANEYGVLLEVVYDALKHKENDLSADMLECLQAGAAEWDI